MMKRCRPLLGTFVEISVPDSATEAAEIGFQAIAKVHRLMSFHEACSDLGRLRTAPAGQDVEVAPETVEVLGVALDLYRESNGLFDVTIGNELVRGGFLPSAPPQTDGRKGYAGSTSADIEIVGPCTVRCHRPMLIDLGGIAKGYAVDKAIKALRNSGVEKALVNAGGDLRMFGDLAWDISLRDADGSVRESVSLANCAIASSANLRNRRRRWGRLSTPHIGFGRRPIAFAGRMTVVAPRCVIADAMTKIAMADRALAEGLLAWHGGYMIAETLDRVAA